MSNDLEAESSVEATPKSRTKVVYLTGFGQFAGVDVNPTELLIQRLKENETEQDDILFEILPVSVNAVDTFHMTVSEDAVAFIHLGVNGTGTSFQLEK